MESQETDPDDIDVEMKLMGGDDLSRTTERPLWDPKAEEEEKEPEKERDKWGSKTEFILACIGYAVGLGNVWRFPWLAQKNGGGAFLIPYCIMLFIEGLPLFYLELSIGQRLHLGPVPLWRKVSKYSSGLGVTTVIAVFLVNCTYNVVIAWCLYYFFISFQSPLPWSTCPTETKFHKVLNRTLTQPLEQCDKAGSTTYYWYTKTLELSPNIDTNPGTNWKITLCLLLAWILVTLCMLKGTATFGKVVYFTATFPYLVISIFVIRGFFLEGFDDGLRHLFTPDWTKLKDPIVWLQAAAQILFSLSIANGGLIAYASYNPTHQNTLRDSLLICFVNCGTSIFAGIAMFSMVGFRATLQMNKCKAYKSRIMGLLSERANETLYVDNVNATNWLQPQYDQVYSNIMKNYTSYYTFEVCDKQKFLKEGSGGTGLAFITMTEAIDQLPGSTFFAIIFFLMLVSLGLSSMFGLLEGIVGSLKDLKMLKNIRNEFLIIGVAIPGFLFGLLFTQRNGEYMLQLFNSYSIDLPLLVIAFCELITIVYVYGIRRFCDDIEFMTGNRPALIWKMLWAVISPVVIVSLLIGMIVSSATGEQVYEIWDSVQIQVRKVVYPSWAIGVGVFATIVPIIITPIVASYYYWKNMKSNEEITMPIEV